MALLLSLLLLSFFLNAFLFVPYINLLYKIKFQRRKQKTHDAFATATPIFDKYHQVKAGTPVGGGLILIVTTSLLFLLVLFILPFFWVKITSVYQLAEEVKILLFTFISFGILGIYDDIKKTFLPEGQFFGLRLRHKLFLEIFLALIIAFQLYYRLKIDIIYLPFFGVWHLGIWYIPFATFVVLAFSNAFNITDGLDGLASGLLMISLIAFWVISSSILDTPLSLFIVLWIGGLIAFLYFNVYPARIFLGDVGALSFGATMAVIGLLLGKAFALIIIGGIFVLEVATSLVQLLSRRFLKRKFFPVAPLHLWLQYRGWPEPKIVMRFWLAGALLAFFGLLIAVMT